MDREELKTMLLGFMEKGLLDNIIDMFKHDESLYPLISDMAGDERMRVRLGGAALAEELMELRPELLISLIPGIGSLLSNPDPVIRGDGAYLLSIIRHEDALPYLLEAKDDENKDVKEIVKEAIDSIMSFGIIEGKDRGKT
ncbi:HEAT repeat domain-containing protein [Thermodesulfovibrionales bacterium]|nr:HEAT repeat domain-containing protein [Thermodesulfovibrionales bacterium]